MNDDTRQSYRDAAKISPGKSWPGKLLPSVGRSDSSLPIRQWTRKLKTRIIVLYLASMIFISCGIGYTLHRSWEGILEKTTGELMHEAGVTSVLVRECLINASKILDIAKSRLEDGLVEGPLTGEKAHSILQSVVGNFSIYDTAELFGFLLYLDADGRLVARNGEYPTQSLDLSERFYFRHLKENPSDKLCISGLRKAQTSGKLVFHISMPVEDGQGRFAGVVAQQIDAQELDENLRPLIGELDSTIMVEAPNQTPSLIYPLPKNPTTDMDATAQTFQLQVNSQERRGGFLASGHSFSGARYVGFECDPLFGFRTIASIPESRILPIFFKENRALLACSLLSSLVISGLFFVLYRQSWHLEKALIESSLDHMTMIFNRRALEKEMARLWSDALRRNAPLSLLFIDIDHFKDFNDSWGHDAGDRVLWKVARLIQHSMRRPLDTCCRWGGEEFVAVLPETSLEAAGMIAGHIVEGAHWLRIHMKGAILPPITLSIGISSSKQEGIDSLEELIRRADEAMLRAKQEGRDRIAFGQP